MSNDFNALLRTPSPSAGVKRKRSDWLELIDGHTSGRETTIGSQDTIGVTVSMDLSQDDEVVRREQQTSYTAAEVLQEIMDSLDSPQSIDDMVPVTGSCGEPSSCLSTATDSCSRAGSGACWPTSKPSLTPRWTPHHNRLVSRRYIRKSENLRSPPDLNTLSPSNDSEMSPAGASSSGFYSSAKATLSRKGPVSRLANNTPRCPSLTASQRHLLQKDQLYCTLSERLQSDSREKDVKVKQCESSHHPTETLQAGLESNEENTVEDQCCSTLSEGLDRQGISTPPPSDTASSSSASGDESTTKSKKLFPIFYMNGRQQNMQKRSTFLNKCKASQSGSPLRKRLRSLDPNQACLNAGQKEIGQITCRLCGMTYSRDQKGERLHEKFHDRGASTLQLGNWKTATVLDTFPGVDNGRCILVMPSSPRHHWNKARAVIELIDDELGMCEGVPDDPFCKASPLMLDDSAGRDSCKGYNYCNKVENKTKFVRCGVSRIWVDAAHRRKGVATRMLDCLRASFFTEASVGVPRSAIAFSTPTADGQAFARSYMTGEDVLVYG